MVGVEQSSLRGLRIYKANVAIKRGSRLDDDRDVWETYPADIIFSAQLLELVERTGARRFLVYTNEGGEKGANGDGVLVSFIASSTCLFEQDEVFQVTDPIFSFGCLTLISATPAPTSM